MPSLILLPGLAADAAMWRHQLHALAKWHPRVSDVHMRHDTIPAMAAAVLAETEGPLILCGASMGGMIAMEAARQAPERVAGLALLGTLAHPETAEMRRIREAAIDLFREGRLREVIEPNVHLAFHRENALAHADDYLEFVLRAGAEQLVRQNLAVIARPDAREHLPRLQCPVLVLCGDADLLAPLECSREIATLAPRGQLAVIHRCGHMLTMEQPEQVSQLLKMWLERELKS
jgi:pimeloyl-ACP methyl ester carboxylesterase